MKCINKHKIKLFICGGLILSLMTACGSTAYELPYTADSQISSFNVISKAETNTAVPFAANLAVVTEDNTEGAGMMAEESGAAALFDLTSNEAIYARNVHEKMFPASLTKVMTALVALENGRLEQILTASSAVNVNESGAQLCGLVKGDTMTLDQALRIMLLNSANDAALLIAENIGGSVEGFVDMMNEKAHELGATNTHFVNPHGLTDAEHYTTAYDLYLIFNEAIKYETFNEIIHMTNYQTIFYDRNGKEKNFNKQTTNLYLRGEKEAPAGVTVIGGKTGTTNAAGHCLIMLSRDVSGAPYISVVLRAPTLDSVYAEMKDLLEEIAK